MSLYVGLIESKSLSILTIFYKMCRILKLLKFFRKTRSAGQFLKIDFFIFFDYL